MPTTVPNAESTEPKTAPIVESVVAATAIEAKTEEESKAKDGESVLPPAPPAIKPKPTVAASPFALKTATTKKPPTKEKQQEKQADTTTEPASEGKEEKPNEATTTKETETKRKTNKGKAKRKPVDSEKDEASDSEDTETPKNPKKKTKQTK